VSRIKTALMAIPVLAFGLGISAGAFAQQQYPGEPLPPPPPAPPQAYQAQPPQQVVPDQAYPAQPPAYPPQGYQSPQAYPPPPPQDAYAAPPPAYDGPPAPPGAVWVGAPGECLYGNGMVYWCAPGVVFSGFPAWWDYARYPVAGFGVGIVVDPVWYNGWRVGRPGFAFRARFATDIERHDWAVHRQEFARNIGPRPGPGYGRPDEHRDNNHY
jgi:hypothetical protein